MKKIIYPPWISKKMKARFDNLLLCIDVSGFIHSCRAYDKEWDFQTRVIWLRINGVCPKYICELLNLNVGTIKHKEFLGLITLNYDNKNYKLCKVMIDHVERRRRSEFMIKRYEDPLRRKKVSIDFKNRWDNPEYYERMLISFKKRWEDPLEHEKTSIALKNAHVNDYTIREKISASHQHIPYDEWESFASDSPYCPAFNNECRESNRNKYNRRCFICDLLEEENMTTTGKWQRLSVHHVDMDKGQGCDGKRWKLVPVCIKHHGLLHSELWISRITWLLENVWCDNENR